MSLSLRCLSVLVAVAWLAAGCPRSEVRPEGGAGDVGVEDLRAKDLARSGPDAETVRTPEAEARSIPDDVEQGDGSPPDAVPAPQSCIEVIPAKLNFGGKLTGHTAVIPLEISCCGDEPLLLYGIRLAEGSSPDFGVALDGLDHEPSPTDPVAVPPGEAVLAHVTFVPDVDNPVDESGQLILDLGTLVIESNAAGSVTEVPVSGAGVCTCCPTAVIKVAEGDEVNPQTVVHLFGDGSYAWPGHSITKWEWDVEQPEGSQSVFVPSYTFPNPTFEVNVAGKYTFYLTVYDQTNTPSCFPAEHELFVVGLEAIHVELTWFTEGDPDETDTGPETGSDLNLHFAHPWAQGDDLDGDGEPDGWFDVPFDCFWWNPHPNWGSYDPAVDDDPHLDIDDTDGAGPENINLDIPENATYRVGVHYWYDHGYGPALATVRIYIYGQFVFEVAHIELQNHDMWEVGTIEWPSGKVNLSTGNNGGYKITPCYTNPYFLARPGC